MASLPVPPPPRRGRRAVLPLGGLLVGALLVGACQGGSSGRLSFAEMQTLNPGVEASWVVEEYPFGDVSRRPDGTVSQISYRVNDPQGETQTVVLVFDERGVLRQKRYSGPIVRPPAGP